MRTTIMMNEGVGGNYLAHTAAWMHAQLDAHRDGDGMIDTRSLFRAAMRHDGMSWQPMTTSARTYQKLAVYVAHAAGQPWHL